jgi:hypothetical protein
MSQRVTLGAIVKSEAVLGDLIRPPFSMRRLPNGEIRWEIESGVDEHELRTEDHFVALFVKLDPVWEQLRSLSDHCELVFSCYVWTDEGEPTPIFVLSNRTLARIAGLRAELNVDF